MNDPLERIYGKIAEMESTLGLISGDLYGDPARHEIGVIRNARTAETVINRLVIVMVFFSFISLINTMTLVWLVRMMLEIL